MKQVRHNVFETNSSSSHTLTILSGGDENRRYLKGNYLLELTDEFSGMDFQVDWIVFDEEQSIEQKLQYMYVYCANNMQLLPAFNKAVDMLSCASKTVIDYRKEDEDGIYYYNKAIDYLYDNGYYINYESSDHLDDFINQGATISDKAEIIYNIITLPKYIIRNKLLTKQDFFTK